MAENLRLAVALNGYGVEHDEPDGMWRELLGWSDIANLARLAERLAYGRIFAPDIGGWEAFTSLAGMAGVTERIGLATGVVRLDVRHPHTLAMASASLQEVSGGRFALGVGSGRPIGWTRGRVEALHDLLASGRAVIEDSGGTVGIETDWAAAGPPPARVLLAALGPRMVRLAGEVADGVILNWCTPERVAEARAEVGDGVSISVYVRACLSHVDEHAAEALRIAAARYVALEPYRRQFERLGVDLRPEAAAAATCVRGDRDRALARLAEYGRAGADEVVVYPVPAGEAVSSISGTLMALAPEPTLEP
ncbi:MAG: LLM class flavin-dependent oxidoreductase [Actinomycetota bacterium]|nr:LLM class flavin-dependent oxidoreductase [Actinomycetota bacterium]